MGITLSSADFRGNSYLLAGEVICMGWVRHMVLSDGRCDVRVLWEDKDGLCCWLLIKRTEALQVVTFKDGGGGAPLRRLSHLSGQVLRGQQRSATTTASNEPSLQFYLHTEV